MKRTSLLICTSVAALSLAAGSAFSQSDGAGAGAGGPPATEMAPPAGGGADVPAQRMEPGGAAGGDMKGAGPAGDEAAAATKPQAQDSTAPSKKSGDTAKSDKAGPDKDGSASSAASGASEGEAGRDAPKSADKASKGAKDPAAGKSANEDASSGASEGAAGADTPSGSVTKLSGEKRTKAQSAFRSHKSEAVVKDIDIDINVGIAVPRSVTLYAVPQDVVVIVPEYRRYKYFIFEDKVVIVDPVTFAIVDVLVLA